MQFKKSNPIHLYLTMYVCLYYEKVNKKHINFNISINIYTCLTKQKILFLYIKHIKKNMDFNFILIYVRIEPHHIIFYRIDYIFMYWVFALKATIYLTLMSIAKVCIVFRIYN